MLTIKEAREIISNFTNPSNDDSSLNAKRSLYTTENIANQSGYFNQQEHWLRDLTEAQAKYGDDKDFKFVYNHIHSAPMQFYLANRLGIDTKEAETAIKQQKLPMMSEAKKFRDDYLPYAKIEGKMKEIN